MPNPFRYLSLLCTYLRAERRRVLLLAVSLLIFITLQLANPQIVRYFIDAATGSGPTSALTGAALLFIGIAITQQALILGVVYLAETIGWNATNALRKDLTRHCLKLDMTFHYEHPPGSLIERTDGDVNALAKVFSRFVTLIISNLLLLVGIVVLLTLADWWVGVSVSTLALLGSLILPRIQRVAADQWSDARQTSTVWVGFLEERLSATSHFAHLLRTGFEEIEA